jgi:hypothetical protein
MRTFQSTVNIKAERHLRVNTSTGAGVTASRAARRSRGLWRGIADRITSAGAPALEGMVETKPVANLMSESFALVVVGRAAAGDGRVEDDNTVVLGGSGVRRRESGIAEEPGAGAGFKTDGVDVESGGGTLA